MSAYKYRHIIWDWNGTLMNDAELCVLIMNNILSKRTMAPISLEDYRDWFDFPLMKYYQRLGFDEERDTFEKISYEFIEQYEVYCLECELHKSTKPILEKLKKRGMSHSILSAYRQEPLNKIVAYYRIASYFIELIGQDNIYAEGKIEKGKAWMERLHFHPGEVLLVGDTVHDFEVAESIGVDCLLISHGHHSLDKLKRCGVSVIDCLEQMEPHLLND